MLFICHKKKCSMNYWKLDEKDYYRVTYYEMECHSGVQESGVCKVAYSNIV